MKKNTTVSTKREQGTSKRTRDDSEAKARGFRVRTSLKAGADPNGKIATNHSETVARSATASTNPQPDTRKPTRNDGEEKRRVMKVRTKIKAGQGVITSNHNETLAG